MLSRQILTFWYRRHGSIMWKHLWKYTHLWVSSHILHQYEFMVISNTSPKLSSNMCKILVRIHRLFQLKMCFSPGVFILILLLWRKQLNYVYYAGYFSSCSFSFQTVKHYFRGGREGGGHFTAAKQQQIQGSIIRTHWQINTGKTFWHQT